VFVHVPKRQDRDRKRKKDLQQKSHNPLFFDTPIGIQAKAPRVRSSVHDPAELGVQVRGEKLIPCSRTKIIGDVLDEELS
jgi:hypothetical protein